MTFYDHILDWTVRLGLIPERFQSLTGLEQYFVMARGKDGIPAIDRHWKNIVIQEKVLFNENHG